MATKLTLQINSLEALEKLLSGDVQLEMDMRNTVVQEYAKKYIKSVAQEFVSSQNRTETEKVMKEFLKKQNYSNTSLNPDFQEKLRKHIEYEVGKIVDNKVKGIIADYEKKKWLEVSDLIMKNITSQKFHDNVSKEVDKRLQDIQMALNKSEQIIL